MKRIVASLWVCWAAYCGTQSNTIPLAFGMTPDQAQAALGVPLVYRDGRPFELRVTSGDRHRFLKGPRLH